MIEAERFARNILKKHNFLYSDGYSYSDVIKHIEDMIKDSLIESKGKYGLEIKNAAWLHDLGQTVIPYDEGKESLKLCRKFIDENFSPSQKEIIIDCILNHGENTNPKTEAGKIFRRTHILQKSLDDAKRGNFVKKKVPLKQLINNIRNKFSDITFSFFEKSGYTPSFDIEKTKKIIKYSAIILFLFIIAIAIYIKLYYNIPSNSEYKNPETTKNAYQESEIVASGLNSSSDNKCIEYTETAGKVNALEIVYDTCSKNKPNYCKEGLLIDNCKVCGCGIYESCGSNSECITNSEDSLENGLSAGGGGGGGGEGGAGAQGGGAVAGASENVFQTSSCTDSDISASPNPIFTNGNCQDNSGSYNDKCQDPITSAESTVWVKEYKCQTIGNTSVCVGVFKSCPQNAENYFGDSNSECSSDKCLIPQITLLNETCSDGVKNQDETDIDCGGVCGGYFYENSCHDTPPEIISGTCSDGIKNQDETDIDCGGVCPQCQEDGEDGGGEEQECYVEPVDLSGLTIFEAATCHDSTGTYENSCASPVGGAESDVFIRTYICIDNKCTPKYYSCPVKGQEIYSSEYYKCVNNECTT